MYEYKVHAIKLLALDLIKKTKLQISLIMDIRKFLKKRRLDDSDKDNLSAPSQVNNSVGQVDVLLGSGDTDPIETQCTSGVTEVQETLTEEVTLPASINPLDIGHYVNCKDKLSDEKLYDILQNTFVPPKNYVFPKQGSRVFLHSWIEQYNPWLAYSTLKNRAFCKLCVLFPQPVNRGMKGAFVVTPFTKYKQFHENAKNHANSAWHKGAVECANSFISTVRNPELRVSNQIDKAVNETIAKNRV